MGNYISCTLPIQIPNPNGGSSSNRHSKIILPNSEIRNVGKAPPTSAAELMLEFPGHFLVTSTSLRLGRGFRALSADEDLDPAGSVYVMFPMQRLNSLVNAADAAPLFLAAAGRKAVRQRRRTSAVTPVAGAVTSSAGEEAATEFMISRRSSLCRSRRPVLEPIAEETSVS